MPTYPDKQTIEQKQIFISDAGVVSAVAVGAGGSSYSAAPTVSFSGGGGQGAEAVAEVAAGVVTAIRITNPGWGYTSAPTITLTPTSGGTGASATATVNTNATSGRFRFMCFVSTFEAAEQRAVQSRPVRSCDTPGAPPVTQNTPGVYSASYNMTGGAALNHLGYMIMRNAVRQALRVEFQDKDDLVASAGGGADRFFGYLTNFQQSMPAEGTVGFTATLTVDGEKTRAVAA